MLGSGREGSPPQRAQLWYPDGTRAREGSPLAPKVPRRGPHCAGLCIVPVKLDGLSTLRGIATGRVSTARKTPSDVALPSDDQASVVFYGIKKKGRGPFRQFGPSSGALFITTFIRSLFSRDPMISAVESTSCSLTPPECIPLTCAPTWCCRDDTGSINLRSDGGEGFKGRLGGRSGTAKKVPCPGKNGSRSANLTASLSHLSRV